MHLKRSSAKWRPFCLALNALISLYRSLRTYTVNSDKVHVHYPMHCWTFQFIITSKIKAMLIFIADYHIEHIISGEITQQIQINVSDIAPFLMTDVTTWPHDGSILPYHEQTQFALHDVTSSAWRFESPATRLIVQNRVQAFSKENITTLHLLFVRESAGNRLHAHPPFHTHTHTTPKHPPTPTKRQ